MMNNELTSQSPVIPVLFSTFGFLYAVIFTGYKKPKMQTSLGIATYIKHPYYPGRDNTAGSAHTWHQGALWVP